MAQSNGDEELSTKLWAILDDYRNLEMPARYGNIDWAEHAIQQLWVADRKQHELDATIDTATDILYGFSRTYKQEITDSSGEVYLSDSHGYISKYEVQELVAKLKAERERLGKL